MKSNNKLVQQLSFTFVTSRSPSLIVHKVQVTVLHCSHPQCTRCKFYSIGPNHNPRAYCSTLFLLQLTTGTNIPRHTMSYGFYSRSRFACVIIPAQLTQLKVNPWKRGTRSDVTRRVHRQLPHMVVYTDHLVWVL